MKGNRPRIERRGAAAALSILIALIACPPASAGALQLFYSFRSGDAVTGPDGGTATFTAEWNNVGGKQTGFVMKQFANGTTLKQAADQTSLSLLANIRFREDWRFTVKNRVLGGFNYYPLGESVAGRKAEGVENSVLVTGIKGMTISAGIDPTIGIASFDIFGDGLSLSPGEVRIGIAGDEVSTTTTRTDGSFKDIPEIKDDLLDALHTALFTSAYIDTGTGFITVPNVSTGDPEAPAGFDAGASFYTTADGIGGFAQVAVVPEPATAVLLMFGGLVIAGSARARRKQDRD